MKKILLTILVPFLVAILAYGVTTMPIADAKVTGPCGDCHTMHNSQNGAPMAKDQSGNPVATPMLNLTRSTCIGCHSGVLNPNHPNVYASTTANMLAGGTFHPTLADSGTKLHNVTDISGLPSEQYFINSVPGKPSGQTWGPTGSNDLTCAGAKGCHGDITKSGSDAGINGFHHGSTAYRFLLSYDGSTQTDIKGKGSSTWEKGGATATNHNVYYAASGSADAKESISALCAKCHGDFHGTTNTNASSPFKRHPTENIIPSSWNATVDYNNNPFAFSGADYNALSTTSPYTATNARVACISCHRAHGSQYDDILRFNYSTQSAGGGGTTGCLGCHTRQR